MHMSAEKLLEQYNEDELFYREYHSQSGDPDKIRILINGIGKEEIIRRGLLVKEVDDSFLTPYEMGDEIFGDNGKREILLSKHNRYTPEFLHSHSFFELIYVYSGSCTHTIADETFTMKVGSFCIVAPHVYHSIAVFDDSVVLNILIKGSSLENTYAALLKSENCISSFLLDGMYADEHAPYLFFRIPNESSLRKMILDMYGEQMGQDEYSEEIIGGLMISFLYRLVRKFGDSPEKIRNAAQNSDAARIYRYFVSSYNNASLSELAKELGYAKTYCSSFIKSATGYSFSQLLKQFRFRKAEELLKDTTLSVSYISEMIGYHDPENFIRAFQNEYGVSPTKYRKCSRSYIKTDF